MEIFGVILVLILSGLLNATGIGGGELFVATLISLFNYDIEQAVGISYSILFGGSLAKTLFSMKLRNSESGKPLINYNVAMILIPAMLMGTIVGQYLNQIFPSLIILICMTLLMCIALFKIYKKAISTKKEEKALLKISSDKKNLALNESELSKFTKRRPTVEQIISSRNNSIFQEVV